MFDPHRGAPEPHPDPAPEKAVQGPDQDAKAIAAAALTLLDAGFVAEARAVLRAWLASR